MPTLQYKTRIVLNTKRSMSLKNLLLAYMDKDQTKLLSSEDKFYLSFHEPTVQWDNKINSPL